jgi:hypothetical protein
MNSLLLLAIIGLLIFIGLLWIFRKRKIVLLIIVLAAGVIGWYGYGEYSRSHMDLINVKAKYNISATELLHEFETGDSTITNKKYDDQVLEISGNVKEIKNNNQSDYTILLGDSNNMSSVQCEMDTAHQLNAAELTKGSSVKIRGHFVGFQKGEMMMDVPLGSDVKLNRCVIIKNKK